MTWSREIVQRSHNARIGMCVAQSALNAVRLMVAVSPRMAPASKT
jgi:hypothetical protein